nr:ABC transporter ATP-binding protein [Actinomadura parmotrematis]
MLQVSGLHVDYAPDVRAVRGASFAVERGEVLGVVGESGSGKSALALAVLGLLPAGARVRGSVRLRGRELLGLPDAALSRVRGKDLAMVFQDPLSALTPVHQVGDQIAETIRVHAGATRRAARTRAVELLELVGVPDAARLARAYPHEFSGGMRQRVMIAMAIANDPLAIVADEPTTSLDATVQAQVLDVLRTAQQATGAAIVLITHDLGAVAGFADRVMVMYAGRAVETGPVGDVYRRPRMPYTIGLLGSLPRLDGAPVRALPADAAPAAEGCPFRTRCPVAVAACAVTEPAALPVAPSGQVAACLNLAATERPGAVYPVPEPVPAPDRPPRRARPPVLHVSGLVRHHPQYRGALYKRRVGAVHAVDGITLDVREGETLGLVGESGCGKTTALMEILRLAAPPGGRVSVLGRDTAALGRAGRKALRRDVQVVFQDPFASLDPRMRVAAILAEPLAIHRVPKDRTAARVRELLELVGLDAALAGRYPQQLSGGQRQRVGIARALALEPRLLLLDEPVAALDASVRAGVLALLRDLQNRLGVAYLFVSHDLAVVRSVADRVAVMYHGRIVEIGPAGAVYGTPAHPYTRALLGAVPVPDPGARQGRVTLPGGPPDPSAPPGGCRFRPRCPRHPGLDAGRARLCAELDPVLAEAGDDDHAAACHHLGAR